MCLRYLNDRVRDLKELPTSRRRTAIGSLQFSQLSSRPETFPGRTWTVMPSLNWTASTRRRSPRRRWNICICILNPGTWCGGDTFQQPLLCFGELLCRAAAVASRVRCTGSIGKIADRPGHVVRQRTRCRVAVIAMATILIDVTCRSRSESMQTDTAHTVTRTTTVVACWTRVAALASRTWEVGSKAMACGRSIA